MCIRLGFCHLYLQDHTLFQDGTEGPERGGQTPGAAASPRPGMVPGEPPAPWGAVSSSSALQGPPLGNEDRGDRELRTHAVPVLAAQAICAEEAGSFGLYVNWSKSPLPPSRLYGTPTVLVVCTQP